jgi:hypothetical protein
VTAQSGALGWPLVLGAEELTADRLDAALERCLSGQLEAAIEEARTRGAAGNAHVRAWLAGELAAD